MSLLLLQCKRCCRCRSGLSSLGGLVDHHQSQATTTTTIRRTKSTHTQVPLGRPLPTDSSHACSVSLPTWRDVVGYEEGDPVVTDAMVCGYPRFVYHPYVTRLMEHVLSDTSNNNKLYKKDCLLQPSRAAATRCAYFLHQALGGTDTPDHCWVQTEWKDTADISIVDTGAQNIHAVVFPATTVAAIQAKAYWQHAGEVVSSRRAERALKQLENGQEFDPVVDWCEYDAPTDCLNHHGIMTTRIADWSQSPSVFLAPSGMAAMAAALRSARRRNPVGITLVFGFPYLDTLKLASRPEICPPGVEFFGHGGDNDLDHLETLLRTKKIAALVTEVPSNPLLQCPNLLALRELAHEYDFALIVDDTIANWLNVDLISTGVADAVCTSLTKLVSGRGDAMAGSIVTNPGTVMGRWMQDDLQEWEPACGDLHPADAQALVANSTDFVARSAQINATTVSLAEWLDDHPAVQTVYYPTQAPHYEQVRKDGYGGLLSLVLHPHMCQRHFYDDLSVAKGPSLGTNFTLVCPYTLLAHYHELDFAMSYDVPPNLIRVAVGMESIQELQDKFAQALSSSQLYPKLTTTTTRTV